MTEEKQSDVEESVRMEYKKEQWKNLVSFEKEAGKFLSHGAVQEDDIAIIGISGKYPMADNIYEFYDNIINKKDCITEIPLSRWDYRKYYDPSTKRS